MWWLRFSVVVFTVASIVGALRARADRQTLPTGSSRARPVSMMLTSHMAHLNAVVACSVSAGQLYSITKIHSFFTKAVHSKGTIRYGMRESERDSGLDSMLCTPANLRNPMTTCEAAESRRPSRGRRASICRNHAPAPLAASLWCAHQDRRCPAGSPRPWSCAARRAVAPSCSTPRRRPRGGSPRFPRGVVCSRPWCLWCCAVSRLSSASASL